MINVNLLRSGRDQPKDASNDCCDTVGFRIKRIALDINDDAKSWFGQEEHRDLNNLRIVTDSHLLRHVSESSWRVSGVCENLHVNHEMNLPTFNQEIYGYIGNDKLICSDAVRM